MGSSDAPRPPRLTRPAPAGSGGGLTDRIDVYPTHEHQGYRLRVGRPFPFGATFVPGGVNFSVYSGHATSCTLVLFAQGEARPAAEIPFPDGFRIGNVYTMIVFDLDVENLEYGYRMTGPFDPRRGHRFDASKVLLDPYARVVGGRDVWGAEPDWGDVFPYRGRLAFDDFDWGGDRPLETPVEDLIIYEMHVRGFTRHPSSGVRFPGTFAGLREKIPYLRDLGVNCVELLPINEFDEFEHSRISPVTGERLMNYWGYSTVGFFAPKAGYAATGKLSMQVDELKALVKELHRNGIEVILDVVFNHTAEGNEKGPHISFRGLDNQTYYMLTPDGYYFNFSGTGNTLNCNNPVVRGMVVDCLRYWAAEYHIDGFRFDLASILGRDPWGAPMSNPPLLESLAFDPVLAKCKLIAEAWDAGGLYQVGSFPGYGRWAEWNGKYRDCVRKFLKGDAGQVGEMASRLQGSPDLYGSRAARTSVNFVTCHDGFTLRDLVSYDHKHNEANGEGNRDGSDDNHSWNCGAEGPTDDPGVNRLRLRQIKNALAILLASHGVPMLLMGDEVGRTQKGNNNAYCQDNEISWFDWGLVEANAELFAFARRCIAFRKSCPLLRRHGTGGDGPPGGAQITWHGVRAWHPEWAGWNRTLAFALTGGGGGGPDFVYAAMNMHWEPKVFELPPLPGGSPWRAAVNTARPAGEDCWPPGGGPILADQHHLWLADRSVVILVGGVAGGA
jgi:glycogen operon protein